MLIAIIILQINIVLCCASCFEKSDENFWKKCGDCVLLRIFCVVFHLCFLAYRKNKEEFRFLFFSWKQGLDKHSKISKQILYLWWKFSRVVSQEVVHEKVSSGRIPVYCCEHPSVGVLCHPKEQLTIHRRQVMMDVAGSLTSPWCS